jgi:hypothetical protein
MKRGSILGSLLVLIIVFTLSLVGCSKKESKAAEKPKEIHNKFLMFEEKSVEDEQSIGDLYLKTDGSEREKISSNVVDGQFEYNNDQDKVFFKNNENELYEYGKDKEKIKLAEDVLNFNSNYNENIVTFQNEDSDLYIIQGQGDDEKIASNVLQYDVIGGNIYFIDDDHDLSMFQIKDNQETEIATDVTYFTDLNGEDEIAYLNDDSELYVKKEKEEKSIKITSEEVSSDSIKKIGDNIVYLNIDDEDSIELYTSPISEGETPTKIASDVSKYKYFNGNYYYVNNDDILYKKTEKDKTSTRVASDVTSFTVRKNDLVYLDKDNNLYKQMDGEKSKKVASSVSNYDVTPKGDVVYSTDDEDLFVNNKKIASDIVQYNYFFENVAFATKDDKLYLMENMGDKKVIEEDLNQYSNAFYQNKNIYMNYLTFEEIAGVWKSESDGWFVEIDKNGTFTNLESGDTEEWEQDFSSGYHTINAYSDESNIELELGKDHTLSMATDMDGTIQLTKSSKDEATKYFENQQMEADKEEISTLIDNYVTSFEYAVNFGSFYRISDYIVPSSPFYSEQEKYVQDAYDRNLYEKLIDYKIENTNRISDDEYSVTVQEIYNISDSSLSEGQEKTFKNTYNVKKIDDEFLINGIKVSQ